LEWRIIDRNRVALEFDRATWLLLQDAADRRDIDTTDMVVEAIAKLLGPTFRSCPREWCRSCG